MPDGLTEVEYFQSFFTDEVIDLFVQETNRYATQMARDKPTSPRVLLWRAVSLLLLTASSINKTNDTSDFFFIIFFFFFFFFYSKQNIYTKYSSNTTATYLQQTHKIWLVSVKKEKSYDFLKSVCAFHLL